MKRRVNTYLISLYISYGLALCEAHFTCEASLLFPKGKLASPPNIRLGICLSYENGCSPRPNLTHNRVTRLVWKTAWTRHVKWNKFPSHTWLPYLTPNGVTHLTMPFIDVQNPIKPCTKNKHNTSELRVNAKMTNDKWHIKSLIINNLGVILSLEIFLKTELTSVNTDIRG